ncbi:MAG: hypothetical protein KME60_07300 [Cyanomargarita calcarea GSE-NOS-MK-12-04C]|uniref:Uncharacterized protein n=1 Tax=Cyanomargarita calcarea GSE-NOS-MK-12-04C TaxID=2839659 RepID=A0A951QMI2_9CYAN|nr:hypothetical protein [Cyanomargarita calcarea GSE-NOS-MK-12-04C]
MKTTTAKQGSVTVHTINGKLRIRLPGNIANGKQYHFYTGLDDTPFYRKQVMMIALTFASKGKCDVPKGNRYAIASQCALHLQTDTYC